MNKIIDTLPNIALRCIFRALLNNDAISNEEKDKITSYLQQNTHFAPAQPAPKVPNNVLSVELENRINID